MNDIKDKNYPNVELLENDSQNSQAILNDQIECINYKKVLMF